MEQYRGINRGRILGARKARFIDQNKEYICTILLPYIQHVAHRNKAVFNRDQTSVQNLTH